MNCGAPLSAKQQRFVCEYLIDLNGSRAAVAAGYGKAGSRVAAHRLLTYANVRAALKARQALDATRLSITRQTALDGLLEAIAEARVSRDAIAMIRGWVEVARLLGLSRPEVQRVDVRRVPGAAAELRRFEAMTDAELEAIMAGGATAE